MLKFHYFSRHLEVMEGVPLRACLVLVLYVKLIFILSFISIKYTEQIKKAFCN